MSADRGTVLVTGGAGFVAYHLIERLLGEGGRVIALDNFDPFYARHFKEGNVADLQKIAGRCGADLVFREQQLSSLTPQAFAGERLDCIFHFAAKAGVRPSLATPEAYLSVNVLGTARVLELCRDLKVPRLIFASSSSVYGDSTPAPFREDAPAVKPVSPYAASKRAAELLCEAWAHLYGLRIAALRFFTVYGPRQRPDLAIHHFTAELLSGRPITLFGDGASARDYTYAGDIVDGVMGAEKWLRQALPGTCEIVNLGGSSPVALRDLVGLLEDALGLKAQVEHAPARPGDVQETWADVSKAGRLFGYRPRVAMAEGLRAFAAWYREAHGTSGSR